MFFYLFIIIFFFFIIFQKNKILPAEVVLNALRFESIIKKQAGKLLIYL